MNTTSASRRPPLPLLLYGALCLLIPALFIGWRLSGASDSARLAGSQPNFVDTGVVVSPYAPGVGPWQERDVVAAVEGVDMETWAQALFRPGLPRPAWQRGDTLTYTVLRGDERLHLPVTLSAAPVGAILRQYWGVWWFAFISQVVATLVLFRQPRVAAAQALFLWAMSGSHSYAWSFYMQIGDLVDGVGFWLFRAATPGLWLLYWPAGLHLALVFPRPLAMVQRRPWLLAGLYAAAILPYLAYVALQWRAAPSMLAWLDSWSGAESTVAAFFLTATIATLAIQHRRSRGAERIKMRWAVYGAVLPGLIGLLFWLLAPQVLGRPVLSANLLGLLMSCFPISLAIAIWRHQLFDIELIIRKTLLYAALTSVLAAVYFGSVVLIQWLLSRLTGVAESPLAVVVSTLAIAALFTPLRRRLQDAIDRRFFRQKYDAQQVLAAFAATARDETDLDALTAELMRVVQQTMQPECASLWLREGESS